ncbi:uncharacterized protein LOC113079376 [Carassius auratus]|uniref:Uncharacterized protein LOC113079376 n=1 Tax=Carassius auratus TaxID=7957 RepID=A0A6P6NDW8_CARAU|nr:uncharacterized protein LOC113079376 [Carassius auratus]
MRPRRVCPEKEALKFIASGKDKDIFQSRVKRTIVDEQKRADLCAFVTTNITKGEEMMLDCGDPDCPWRQVAGCLVHYILTDGQHPHQTTTPYTQDPLGNSDTNDDLSEIRAASSEKTSVFSLGYISKSLVPLNQNARARKPWSETERKVIEHCFKIYFKEIKAPGKVDCERCINANRILKDNGRDWKTVKYFVLNRIISVKRSLGEQY